VLGVAGGDGVGSTDLSADPQLAVAFSGFLDNLEQLTSDLEARGDHVDARTPAAVLRAAFRAFGAEAPRKLRGVFAALVTDGRAIWGFRDHVGFRPLFYRDEPRGAFLGTEAKQVVAGAQTPYEPDLEVVQRIFYGRAGEDRRCAIRGVERLPPATILEADRNGVRLTRYWDPESLLETARVPADEVQARFDFLMSQAVGRSLVGQDVLLLSGGVDSPAIAAYANPIHHERTGEPLPCLSTVYPKFPSVDESRYITAVAERLGMPLHTYQSRVRATDRLLDWVRLVDGPVPVVSLAEAYETLDRAKALGYRNTLSGEFAEFVFAMQGDLFPYLLTRGRLRPAFAYVAYRRSRGASMGNIVRQAVRAFVPPWLLSAYRRARGRPEPRRTGPAWIDPARLNPLPQFSGRRAWREQQLGPLQATGLSLEADDAIQALAGVSTRRPFADIDMWEFFLALPAEIKFPSPRSKHLVRTLLRGKVPDLILDRTDKTYFDEAIVAGIDYAALRRWLLDPPQRMDGVDYTALGKRLEQEKLNLVEYMWAKNLAGVHAFLSQW
ncbi:MAG: asparagine synthase-related protein, partial [Gemmatimonadales bacterium]|jgi:asparagine synthase (glutamine-hydrolysing)